MNTNTTLGACGTEELPRDLAMAIEGGGPILTGVTIGLTIYAFEHADDFVKGLIDGWNAYGK